MAGSSSAVTYHAQQEQLQDRQGLGNNRLWEGGTEGGGTGGQGDEACTHVAFVRASPS